ncbi:MAG: hypothetical protein K6D61_09035, partial [Prevotella sp.]|nr:hypothetical protein [Prevotella sp.]
NGKILLSSFLYDFVFVICQTFFPSIPLVVLRNILIFVARRRNPIELDTQVTSIRKKDTGM